MHIRRICGHLILHLRVSYTKLLNGCRLHFVLNVNIRLFGDMVNFR
jgi:hypothetical protein